MYIGVCGAENFEVTGHVRTEGGHEGSLPPELTFTNINAHRHLIQHYPHHPKKQHTKAVAFSLSWSYANKSYRIAVQLLHQVTPVAFRAVTKNTSYIRPLELRLGIGIMFKGLRG